MSLGTGIDFQKLLDKNISEETYHWFLLIRRKKCISVCREVDRSIEKEYESCLIKKIGLRGNGS